MRKSYDEYQRYLGEIPEFLKPYLELDIIVRLKDISLMCGMDYASKSAYDFAFYISRFDHSLNTALITWKLTEDKKATLAALFHDVSTPVFSHVIDYMNGDLVNQESTEEKTEEILHESPELAELLRKDGIDLHDICDFKQYSVVDLKRPKMCADRLDNIIAAGMSWLKRLTLEDALKIMDSVILVPNEDDEMEIGFNDEGIAEYLTLINDGINYLTHTKEDTYMMLLLADIVRICLELEIISYNELFRVTEHYVLEVIESNLDLSKELKMKWHEFKTIKTFPHLDSPEIRDKVINPIVVKKRLKPPTDN